MIRMLIEVYLHLHEYKKLEYKYNAMLRSSWLLGRLFSVTLLFFSQDIGHKT